MSDQITMSEPEDFGTALAFGIRGRLEASGAWQLYQRCRELREDGRSHLILLLDGVTFMASSGVGTLLQLAEEFKKAGGRIVYAKPSEAVTRVVDLLNLEEYLDIQETLDDALRRAAA
jgi:anti-sigma B factor antagonist